jgi:outer membrane protein assembly factor BamE
MSKADNANSPIIKHIVKRWGKCIKMQKFMLTHITVGILAVSLLSLSQSACSMFGVYKIDIPQGTPLTKEKAAQVKMGMTMQQVRYLIGTPAIIDTLNPNRWDYVYTYIPGTLAVDAGLKPENGQHMIVTFDSSGKVNHIQGADSFPSEQPGIPDSQDPGLSNKLVNFESTVPHRQG